MRHRGVALPSGPVLASYNIRIRSTNALRSQCKRNLWCLSPSSWQDNYVITKNVHQTYASSTQGSSESKWPALVFGARLYRLILGSFRHSDPQCFHSSSVCSAPQAMAISIRRNRMKRLRYKTSDLLSTRQNAGYSRCHREKSRRDTKIVTQRPKMPGHFFMRSGYGRFGPIFAAMVD